MQRSGGPTAHTTMHSQLHHVGVDAALGGTVQRSSVRSMRWASGGEASVGPRPLSRSDTYHGGWEAMGIRE
jgi:hypothetical protein